MQIIHTNNAENSSTGKNTYRDRIELLRSRVGLLTGKDRLLMTMYLENGNTFRQMARLAGVNESNIARRIHRITKRLIDGEYIMCLRNRDKFTSAEMAIAKDYFLRGLPQRRIASKRNCSFHHVIKTLRRIHELIRTVDNQ